jgi:hypothetical protein
MAEALIKLMSGSTPRSPAIHALVSSGDPNPAATTDADLDGAPDGSILIRRDGAPGAFLYRKHSAAPASALAWLPNDRLFDITTYGAVGDGITDNSAAIANAIKDAALVCGTVYVPPGTFRFGTTLVFPNANMTLELAGGATLEYTFTVLAVNFLGTGCVLRGQSAAASIIRCLQPCNGVEPASSSVITDVTVEGPGTTVDRANAITCGSIPDVVIQRCVIKRFSFGINAGQHSARWLITDNWIHDCSWDGIYASVGTTDCIITNNVVSDIGRNGIDVNDGGHIIAGNRIEHCGLTQAGQSFDWWGILLQPVTPGPGGAPGSSVVGCVLSGNHVTGCLGQGIALLAANNATCSDNLVIGNIVSECGGGIAVDSDHFAASGASIVRNAIVGNVCRNNAGVGIDVYNDNRGTPASITGTLIANNVVTGNGANRKPRDAAGIRVWGVGGISTVTDNAILHNIVVGNADGVEATQIQAGPTAVAPNNGARRTTIAGNKTEQADNVYSVVEQADRTPVAIVELSNAAGAAVADVTGAHGSAYQVNDQ